MPTILLNQPVPNAWLDAFAEFLRAHPLRDAELNLCQPEGEGTDPLSEADVLLVGLAGQQRPVERDTFEHGENLKLVVKIGSRRSGVDLQAADEHGVPVTFVPAPAHVACAEHTMLLILAAVKDLLAAHHAITNVHEPEHTPRESSASEYAVNWLNMEDVGLLAGKTLGLVGMGDIAIEVARRASAFDLALLYTDTEPLPEEEEQELGLSYRELDGLLAEADIVSLHTAHTPETEQLINAERLDAMKPTAILVNTARGGLVDEEALIATLAKDHIGGAALDVWAEEPTAKDNPLLALDNVVATPHIAAGTLPEDALYQAVLAPILDALGLEEAEQEPAEEEPEPETQEPLEEEDAEENEMAEDNESDEDEEEV
jgi:phosphoglycerate dehydrogenase-like enzyme